MFFKKKFDFPAPFSCNCFAQLEEGFSGRDAALAVISSMPNISSSAGDEEKYVLIVIIICTN